MCSDLTEGSLCSQTELCSEGTDHTGSPCFSLERLGRTVELGRSWLTKYLTNKVLKLERQLCVWWREGARLVGEGDTKIYRSLGRARTHYLPSALNLPWKRPNPWALGDRVWERGWKGK